MSTRRPVLGRYGNSRLREHQVGDHGPGDAPGDLSGEVGSGFLPAQATKGGVHERHDGVEMAPGYGAEHQDDGKQAGRGGGRVLEQLEADCARREVLGCDPRADDRGSQEGTAEELGQETSPKRRHHHVVRVASNPYPSPANK